jgi:hypothetical protein
MTQIARRDVLRAGAGVHTRIDHHGGQRLGRGVARFVVVATTGSRIARSAA